MTASWVFPSTPPIGVQGRGLAEDNFAQEERSWLEILIREAFQNPLDARATGVSGPVRVRLDLLRPGQFDAAYLSSLLTEEYVQRLEASGGDPLLSIENASVLILEDFGTTGLEGNFENPDVDGSPENNQENWNAFWFREGEGAKSAAGSNGRAGQGKITYYRVGGARAVFGLTVRQSDGKRLLMGRSSFRRVYRYGDSKYGRDAFWCEHRNNAHPITDADEMDHFCAAFKLSRKAGESGLSLVIPFASEIDAKEAMQTVVAEYYVPIMRGRLEVIIGDKQIDRINLDAIASQVFSDDEAHDRKSSFTEGFRGFVRQVIEGEGFGVQPLELKLGWEKANTLNDTYFPEGTVESVRERLSKGELVSIRFPIAVKPKKQAAKMTWFDVHLEVPDDLDRVGGICSTRSINRGGKAFGCQFIFAEGARTDPDRK